MGAWAMRAGACSGMGQGHPAEGGAIDGRRYDITTVAACLTGPCISMLCATDAST